MPILAPCESPLELPPPLDGLPVAVLGVPADVELSIDLVAVLDVMLAVSV